MFCGIDADHFQHALDGCILDGLHRLIIEGDEVAFRLDLVVQELQCVVSFLLFTCIDKCGQRSSLFKERMEWTLYLLFVLRKRNDYHGSKYQPRHGLWRQ